MKILPHAIACLLLIAGWVFYFLAKSSASDMREMAAKIDDAQWISNDLPEQLKASQDSSEKKALAALIKNLKNRDTDQDETYDAAILLADEMDGSSTFVGIFLVFLSAGYAGICFVIYVLPQLAQRATHTIFDSGEMIEPDAMSLARSKLAQGEYLDAMEEFRKAAEKDSANRMPWMEIIKIQRDVLSDPSAAAQTICEVLEIHPWPEDDAAYFLFRLAEIQHTDLQDLESARAALQRVIQQFPETRHSANALHQLQSWELA